MLSPWLTLLVAALTGGLMGAIVNVLYQRAAARSAAENKQKAMVNALAGELRRTRALCDYNASLRQDSTGPFVEFPTTAATSVCFAEPQSYPRLLPLQGDLVHYSMALFQLNQLIELHHLLWTSPELPSGVSPGASGRRDELRIRIALICAGDAKLEGVGTEGFLYLPKYVEYLAASINKVIQ
jgi:hypothetical protein